MRLCLGRVGLSVIQPVSRITANEQICIKLLPEVCLGQMNRLLNFGDDPDYDPDQEFEFPVYDVDRAAKACSL